MRFKTTALIGGTLLATMSLSANAALIEGDIGFGGGFTPRDSQGSAEVSLGEADYIDILQDQAFVTTTGTGDLASLTLGTTVNYNDFVVGEAPAGTLWSGGGFSFTLNSMNVIEHNDTVLGLAGEGIMSAEGFEDTPYLWSFSGDGAGDTTEFAFSSTATDVPEPGTLSLLGLGLVGLGLARRRRAS